MRPWMYLCVKIMGEGTAPPGRLPERIQEAALVISGRSLILRLSNSRCQLEPQERIWHLVQAWPSPCPSLNQHIQLLESANICQRLILSTHPPTSHSRPAMFLTLRPRGKSCPALEWESPKPAERQTPWQTLSWHKNRLPLALVSRLVFSQCNLTLTLWGWFRLSSLFYGWQN